MLGIVVGKKKMSTMKGETNLLGVKFCHVAVGVALAALREVGPAGRPPDHTDLLGNLIQNYVDRKRAVNDRASAAKKGSWHPHASPSGQPSQGRRQP